MMVYFQPGDHSVRLEEAILRSVTSTVVNMTFPDASKLILNPNEVQNQILSFKVPQFASSTMTFSDDLN